MNYNKEQEAALLRVEKAYDKLYTKYLRLLYVSSIGWVATVLFFLILLGE